MNISFHYFLVKTLAHEACKVENVPMESRAQEIAYYSQLIDDYILCDTYIRLPKGYKPPEFFFKHKLAEEEKNPIVRTATGSKWKFFPANTGIPDVGVDMIKSITVSQQTYTFTPFHFIPPKPLTEMDHDSRNRYHYQCEKAGEKNILIDHLIQEFKKMEPMQLGMLLHTYADTYAHEKFSGFDMTENNVLLDDIWDRSQTPTKKVTFNSLYNTVPAIGHARLAHVPDAFALSFKYHHKATKEIVERYNMDSFMDCARNISNILFQYNGKPILSDGEWNRLKSKLILAGNACVSGATELTNIGDLKDIWKTYFPDVIYEYNKNGNVSVKSDMTKVVNTEELSSLESLESSEYNIGNSKDNEAQITIGNPTYTPVNGEVFFKFHQYAYEHIYAVTGAYRQVLFK